VVNGTSKSIAVVAALIGALLATATGTTAAPAAAGKKHCKFVIRVVHHHKHRVRVCHTVKPKPKPKPDPLAGSHAVTFAATDGLSLEGRLWGKGTNAVVLVHGNSRAVGQGEWFRFAAVLATKGYSVLTFDLGGFCPGRGYGCSGSDRSTVDTWLDVAGAVDFVRAQGGQKVFLIGGSLGGHTVLWAAAQPSVDVEGVVALSAPQNALGGPELHYDLTPDVLGQIHVPKLFIAARQDVEEGYSPAADAQSMYDASPQPKELLVLGSSLHASDLLTIASGDRTLARQAVFDFLSSART
jgi:pimeloyl-ACP methyl ester carboxylesterase